MMSPATPSSLRAAAKSCVPGALLLTLMSMSGSAVLAEVLWRGDFETGTTEQWKGAPKSDAIQVVTELVREGKYALRIDGSNAARRKDLDRIELQHQPKAPGTAEGTERYSAGASTFPKSSCPVITRSATSRRATAGASS